MTKKTTHFYALLALTLLINSVYAAPESPRNVCFNMDQPVKNPLKTVTLGSPRIGRNTAQAALDTSQSGKMEKPGSGIWGAARGIVNKPIQSLYEKLLDHYTIKDPKKVKVKVYPQDKNGFKDYHIIMVKVPTPLADVHWEEEWGYVLSEGSTTAPKKYVVSYQKTNGTRFVPHLCGSIILTAIDSTHTEVYLYEEVDALGKRSPKDTVQGHFGTLATLRGEITP